MTAVQTKPGFLERLTNTVYLDYVLKVFGIILFGLALMRGWHELGLVNKTLLVCGPIAWYVGARFTKIYRP